jgi:hypothetical protein
MVTNTAALVDKATTTWSLTFVYANASGGATATTGGAFRSRRRSVETSSARETMEFRAGAARRLVRSANIRGAGRGEKDEDASDSGGARF